MYQDMELDDDPVNLEDTVERINTWYNEIFPPLQNLGMRLYDNFRSVADGNGQDQSLITFYLKMFDMSMTPNFILQYQDGDGVHTGIEALSRAHAAYADRIIQLQIGLTTFDMNCPLLGDVGDQARNQPHYDHPSTNADHIRHFHRLQGVGENALRHLMTFSSSMNVVDDQLFGMGIQQDGQYHWLTMQSSYFRVYGKQLNNSQMVELYIGNLLISEQLRISGDWIYEPCLVVQERPIVYYNENIGKKEYICALCGRPESEHIYTEPQDNEGRIIHKLLPSSKRTKHAFQRLVRPIEASPKRFTGTYKRKCSVEEYVRIKTSQRVHMKMWTLRTTSSVSILVENLKKSVGGDVPIHTTIAARAYSDGQINCKTGRWYENRCRCHSFMSEDAKGYEIDSLEKIGMFKSSTGTFEIDAEVVPEYVPDDNRPTVCECCGACPQPFSDSAALFQPTYMDYDKQIRKMAGNFHPVYIEVEDLWVKFMVEKFTEDMTEGDIEEALPEEASIDFESESWREDAIDILRNHSEFVDGIVSTKSPEFFDEVNDNFFEHSENTKAYCCTICNKYLNHPDHDFECVYEPSSVDFNICEKCGLGPNDPSHKPRRCRAKVLAPLFENMAPNSEEICYRCERNYETCVCPGKWGFFPYRMMAGSEVEINTAYDTIFLNHVQDIPFEAYHFIVAMMGRVLGEFIGENTDNIQGCVLLHGPKRTGKSELLGAVQGWFPPDQRGDIPDSAEEQWWSAHLIDPVTHKTVKLVTCMELSHKCKVPMTEWQKM